MTKQEKIQEAYGDKWDLCKDKIDSDGYIRYKWIAHGVGNGNRPENFGFKVLVSEIQTVHGECGDYKWRPRSLQNIETNNGWTKIESPEDLPKDSGEYLFLDNDGKKYSLRNFRYALWPTITHWREIVEIPNPIY